MERQIAPVCGDVDPEMRYFTPHSHPLDAALRRYNERPTQMQPSIDATEAFLLAVFLRRYITTVLGAAGTLL